MSYYIFMLGVLSVWRLTHLLYAEDGPWDILVRLRSRAGHGVLGGLLDCYYCLSLWIAVPFGLLIGEDWSRRLLLWLALSGGASLIERAASRERYESKVQYFEDKEQSDVVLRSEEGTIPPKDVGTGV